MLESGLWATATPFFNFPVFEKLKGLFAKYCDGRYSVVAYGSPGGQDLPIFVDLDVLADMEAHAESDTSVELGGVLLGGQYEDDQGAPFVVITFALRAQHYKATKGSFTLMVKLGR